MDKDFLGGFNRWWSSTWGLAEEEICEAVLLAQTSSGDWQKERPGVGIQHLTGESALF